MKYYSQFGQDKLIHNLFFLEKKEGFFIDIGASDGIDINNSYFFEKNLNWKGICVEPRKSAFKELIRNRNCICENIGLSDKSSDNTFVEYLGKDGVYSGLKDKYDYRHEKIVKTYALPTAEKIEIKIKTTTLKELCYKYNINHIDYCSIDTEGGELDIIKSIKDSKITIDVISIENNFNDKKIRKYLKTINFLFITKIGCDEIYVSKNLYKKNIKKTIRERINYEYYRLIPLNIRMLLHRSGIPLIIKFLLK